MKLKEKLLSKQFVISKAYSPTDEDRKKVAEIVGKDADDFGIYRTVASSTDIDSERDMFTLAFLEAMGKQYNEGRQVSFMHERGHGVGRTFDSEIVQRQDGQHELFVKFYVVPDAMTPTGNAKSLIDAKVFDRTSVMVAARPTEYVDSEKSQDGKGYYVFGEGKGMQVIHLGLVDMGANQAAIFKSQKSTNSDLPNFGQSEDDLPNSFMNLSEYKIKSLGEKTVSVPEEALPAIKRLDTEFEDLQKRLKAYEAKEEAELQKLKDAFVSAKNQLNPSATDAEKERFKTLADAFSGNPDLLKSETEVLQKQIELNKASQNLDPSKKGGKKGDPQPVNSKSILESWNKQS